MGIAICISFALGALLMLIIDIIVARQNIAGILHVFTKSEDGPEMYVELSQNLDEISKEEFVTFKVKHNDSQK